MEDIEVHETMMMSDISEGSSSGDDSGVDGGLLRERVRGVRNGDTPPFVTKLYELVSDKANESIISWVSSSHNDATSFAIWKEADFVNNVLPLISKSRNFNSFISQLNNYGFKKQVSSWNRWEYANEWFQEGKQHLLKHIKRRNKQTTCDNERMTREIEKLENESKRIDYELHTFKVYVDNTISNQKKILEAIENVIELIVDHRRSYEEAVIGDNGTPSFNLVGQQSHDTNELGESSFSPNYEIPNKKVNKISNEHNIN